MPAPSSCETPRRIEILATSVSMAGIVCLGLAGLLPWPVLAVLATVHAAVLGLGFARVVLGTPAALTALGLVSSLEIWRILMQGNQAVMGAVRDLVVAVAVVRLLAAKTGREIRQMALIAVAEAVFATILTTSPLFVVGLGLVALLVPMTLDALDEMSFGDARDEGRTALRHWVTVFLGLACLTCALFYVLPRPASSVIRHGLVHERGHSFDENVDLRSLPGGAADDDVVMRIVWRRGGRPGSFYLAGARLEAATPHGFSRSAVTAEDSRRAATCRFRPTDMLTVYQTDLASELVFHPFTLCSVRPAQIRREGANIVWTTLAPVTYDLLVSRTPDTSAPARTGLAGGHGRLADLARRVAGNAPRRVQVARLAAYLRSTCAYSLDAPGAPRGVAGIEWFVFSGRKGACEHFASALAAMAREIGIPARVVSGFFVSEFNEGGGYFIVRARHAHAWVEYFDGAWRTADATPSGPMRSNVRFHALDRLRFLWVRWVVEYSLDDQVRVAFMTAAAAGGFGRAVVRVPGRAALAVGLAGFAAFLAVRLAGVSRRSHYEKVLRVLRRRGMDLPATAPHEAHLEEVASVDASTARAFEKFLRAYLAWRFGNRDGCDIRSITNDMLRAARRASRARKTGNTPGWGGTGASREHREGDGRFP